MSPGLKMFRPGSSAFGRSGRDTIGLDDRARVEPAADLAGLVLGDHLEAVELALEAEPTRMCDDVRAERRRLGVFDSQADADRALTAAQQRLEAAAAASSIGAIIRALASTGGNTPSVPGLMLLARSCSQVRSAAWALGRGE